MIVSIARRRVLMGLPGAFRVGVHLSSEQRNLDPGQLPKTSSVGVPGRVQCNPGLARGDQANSRGDELATVPEANPSPPTAAFPGDHDRPRASSPSGVSVQLTASASNVRIADVRDVFGGGMVASMVIGWVPRARCRANCRHR